MLALSIRQPFAELILQGLKTIEYRSRKTSIIGERFWIYASKKSAAKDRQWAVTQADNIVVPTDEVPPWIVELANGLKLFPEELPSGVIVGSAIIERVTSRSDGMYQWHLSNVERAAELRKPDRQPQPIWFRPF